MKRKCFARRSIIGSLIFTACLAAGTSSCAPRIVSVNPSEGAPGNVVTVSMQYLVGWPRVEIAGYTMDWPQLKLIATDPQRSSIPGEELVWIEDKFLQFRLPDIPPGEYVVTIHDDKGPPGDLMYSFLETSAYVVFPPVWPFVFRTNQAQFKLRVLPKPNPSKELPK
ncbi:MAG TPA: hypothetical protein VGK77_25915 [Candidatus Binatia bacterium]|jgi:hypothetical protein